MRKVMTLIKYRRFFSKTMSIIQTMKLSFIKLVLASLLFFPSLGSATVVRMKTSLGVVDIQLFDSTAPLTVANFLSYVDSGAYNRSFIHRSVPGFVIQGGMIALTGTNNTLTTIATNPPVTNEFSASRPNVRGTIAMAKVADDPNSATSQWFFNLVDNSTALGNQNNGGFTVFGKVLEKGMSVVDAIAALPLLSASPQFNAVATAMPFFSSLTALPLASPITGSLITVSNLVMINSVSSNRSSTTASDSDRLFAYAEAAYPEYLSPANTLSPTTTISASWEGYYYRYYSATNAYIGTSNGMLYYMGPASQNQIVALGPVSWFLAEAIAKGY